MTGESFGSTAMAWKEGFRGLMTSTQPVIVPPVPTAGDQDVHLAVRVVPDFLGGGLACEFPDWPGFSNCCGIQAFGVSLASCSARAMAPFMPSVPGVSTSFAPSIASNVRRSSDIVSGMVRMSL